MSTTVIPSASLVGVVAGTTSIPVLGGDPPPPETAGAFAQMLAAIEGEVAEVPATAEPTPSALPSVIDAVPSFTTTPETPIAENLTTIAAFETVELPTMEIPPSVLATSSDDATIEPAPALPAVTIAELPEPTDMQPITPNAEPTNTPPTELVRAATPAEVAAPDAETPQWTAIVDSVLAEPHHVVAPEHAPMRATEEDELPFEPIACTARDEVPPPDPIFVASPALPPPPIEIVANADVNSPAPETKEEEIELDAPPIVAPEAMFTAPAAPMAREPAAIERDAPSSAIDRTQATIATRSPMTVAPSIAPQTPSIATPTPRTIASEEPVSANIPAAPAPSTPQFASTPVAPGRAAASRAASPAPASVDAPAEQSHAVAPRVVAATPEPTRVTTPTLDAIPTIATPTLDTPTTLDAMPTIDPATREAPPLEAPTATPAPAIETSPRAPIDTPPKPPIVLARAEDLALAIEELRPIPRGGATVEVEAPGLGAIRLHVAVDGDTVKIRIHAGSEAIAWFAREHDGLCSAARQAVPESQQVDLQLHTGADSRGNQSQPHARTYASDDAPQPSRMRAPSSHSEAAPSSTSPHALVDVLA